MIDAKKFYINGEWITPTNSETIDVINPANEKSIYIYWIWLCE